MYKYIISNQDIQKVPLLNSKYLQEDETKLIRLLSQYVLTISMLSNNSNEVSLIVNVLDITKRVWIFGNQFKVSIPDKYMNVYTTEFIHSCIMIHNHPSNSGFSKDDLYSFFKSNTLYILVAIQNNGSIHVLKKFRFTDLSYAEWVLNKFKTVGDYLKHIQNTDIDDIVYIYRRFKI